MRKTAVILLIIVAVVVGVGFALKACDQTGEPPDADAARYKVIADNKYYLTNSYSKLDDGGLILHGYFSFDNGVWKYHKQDLPLAGRAYKRLEAVERTYLSDGG